MVGWTLTLTLTRKLPVDGDTESPFAESKRSEEGTMERQSRIWAVAGIAIMIAGWFAAVVSFVA